MLEKTIIITGTVIGVALIACTAICCIAMTSKAKD